MIYKHLLLITYLTEPKRIPLHTVKWFQAFLSQTVLFVSYLVPYEVQPLRAMKGHRTFSKAQRLEPHDQMV